MLFLGAVNFAACLPAPAELQRTIRRLPAQLRRSAHYALVTVPLKVVQHMPRLLAPLVRHRLRDVRRKRASRPKAADCHRDSHCDESAVEAATLGRPDCKGKSK
jgi:hypothetical protein